MSIGRGLGALLAGAGRGLAGRRVQQDEREAAIRRILLEAQMKQAAEQSRQAGRERLQRMGDRADIRRERVRGRQRGREQRRELDAERRESRKAHRRGMQKVRAGNRGKLAVAEAQGATTLARERIRGDEARRTAELEAGLGGHDRQLAIIDQARKNLGARLGAINDTLQSVISNPAAALDPSQIEALVSEQQSIMQEMAGLNSALVGGAPSVGMSFDEAVAAVQTTMERNPRKTAQEIFEALAGRTDPDTARQAVMDVMGVEVGGGQ